MMEAEIERKRRTASAGVSCTRGRSPIKRCVVTYRAILPMMRFPLMPVAPIK